MSRVVRPSESSVEEDQKDPIFCCKCKHIQKEMRTVCFPRGDTEQRELYVCRHPRNIRHKITWLSKEEYYARSPKTINKNNDCIWFECIPPLVNNNETRQGIADKINQALNAALEERSRQERGI